MTCQSGFAGVEVEVGEPFDAWELRVVDTSRSASFGAGVDFGFEDLGEKSEVGQLGSFRIGGPSSGVGRLHGDAGIREFAVPKAVATSRLAVLPGLTGSMFGPVRPSVGQVGTVLRLLWGRGAGG